MLDGVDDKVSYVDSCEALAVASCKGVEARLRAVFGDR